LLATRTVGAVRPGGVGLVAPSTPSRPEPPPAEPPPAESMMTKPPPASPAASPLITPPER
ncbi:MAG TPA: DUF454 domain-containing protein, partial [Rhodospirillum rubrum]|nr:DUF454 domain-containing protein [Rhodospirillum rubrum]